VTLGQRVRCAVLATTARGGERPQVIYVLECPSHVERGNTMALGARTLRVLRVEDDDADQPVVLVVEDIGPIGR
jgi:hypothetical protein